MDFKGGRLGVVLLISDPIEAGDRGGWGLGRVERWGGARTCTAGRWGEEEG